MHTRMCFFHWFEDGTFLAFSSPLWVWSVVEFGQFICCIVLVLRVVFVAIWVGTTVDHCSKKCWTGCRNDEHDVHLQSSQWLLDSRCACLETHCSCLDEGRCFAHILAALNTISYTAVDDVIMWQCLVRYWRLQTSKVTKPWNKIVGFQVVFRNDNSRNDNLWGLLRWRSRSLDLPWPTLPDVAVWRRGCQEFWLLASACIGCDLLAENFI